MSNDRFASAHEMVREYAELEAKMADPSIHEDQANARKLGRRYAQLGPVVAGFKAWIISSSSEGFMNIGLKPAKKIDIFNGPLPCSFRCYELFEGSHKQSVMIKKRIQ